MTRPPAATAHRTAVQTFLLRGSIIAQSPEGAQRWQSARLHQLYLDAPVLAISFRVLWRVADYILIAQLDTNFGRDVRQLVQVLHGEMASAGLFRDFAQQSRPSQFFRCAAARGGRLEDPDRINLYVRLAHQVLDFRFRVAA